MVKPLYFLYVLIIIQIKCNEVEIKYKEPKSQQIYKILSNINYENYHKDCFDNYNYKECLELSKKLEKELNLNNLKEIESLDQTDKNIISEIFYNIGRL